MYDPYFNSLSNLIDVGNTIVYDDIQFYTDLATINALTEKNLQTRYVDESSGDEYRWNGTTLILMNSGSGAINITAGNQINITGTIPNQIINVNTDPTFTTINTTDDHTTRQNLGLGDNTAVLDGQILIGNTLNNNFSKSTLTGETDYINIVNGAGTSQITINNTTKTKINNAIQTITNSDGNIIINTTDPVNPVVNIQDDFSRRAGAYNGFRFLYNTPLSNGGQISSNSGITASTTQMTVGTLPVNRTLIDITNITQVLTSFEAHFPFIIRVIDTNNLTLYADFAVNSLAGTGADSRTYNVSFYAGTLANFPVNGTRIVVYLNPLYQASSTRTLTAGNYITVSNVQTNLSALDTQLGTNTTKLNLMNKNTTENSSILFLNGVSSVSAYADLYIFTANGSFDYVSPLNIYTWNRCVIFSLLHKKTIYRSNAPRRLFFAVQLYGIGWATLADGLAGILIGFTTEASLERVQNWMTTPYIAGFTGVWDSALTGQEKMIRARFNASGQVQFVYGNAGVLGTRTGAYTETQPITNDVLLFFLDTDGYFTLQLRRASDYTVVASTGRIIHPDGVKSSNNFNLSPLVPVVSSLNNNIDYGFRTLSKRDTDLLNITLTDGENVFF